MARFDNEAQAIENLQRYLRQLSYFNPELTKVPIDGIYERDTQRAVAQFQRLNGLTETGTADRETWDLIFEQYRESIAVTSPPEEIALFPRNPEYYAIKKGDSWFIVEMLQYMLGELQLSYDGFGELERTGIYDDATVGAILDFQKRNSLAQTGETDRLTWNLIVNQFNIGSKAYEQ